MSWARTNWEVVFLVLFASAVYQPWNVAYLPLTDFGILVVERGTSHSLWAQFAGIAGYYVAEGRLLLFEYMHMALASAVFGLRPQGWYWTYFILMSAVMFLGRSVMLKTGVNRTAAFIAIALWATMEPVAEGWIMPTGEPIALIFFLLAMRLAVNYCDASDWRRRAWLIGGCAIGIVFSKELLVVLLPAAWVLSRLRLSDTEWQWVRWTERDTFVLKVISACVVVALIPVAYVFARAAIVTSGFHYGDVQAWKVTVERIEAVLVPASPRLRRLMNIFVDPGFTLLLTLPSLLWIRLVLGGVATGPRKRIMWPVVIGSLWVLLGVAVYFPWPRRAGYYLLPFALGTMFMAAHSFTLLLDRSKSARWACIVVSAILLGSASVEARTVLHQHQQRAQLNAELIDKIARLGGARLLIGATPNPASGRDGWASHLKGFGSVAMGIKVEEVRDMSCADAKHALETTPGVVVVSAPGGCGVLSPHTEYVSAVTSLYKWPNVWEHIDAQGRMYITTYHSTAVWAPRSAP